MKLFTLSFQCSSGKRSKTNTAKLVNLLSPFRIRAVATHSLLLITAEQTSPMKPQIDSDDICTSLKEFNIHQTSGECRTNFCRSSPQTLFSGVLILQAIRPCAVKRVWLRETTLYIQSLQMSFVDRQSFWLQNFNI